MRFNWVLARCEALDEEEMRELVLDAWRMVVPKKVWTALSEERAGGAAGLGASLEAVRDRQPPVAAERLRSRS